MSGWIFTLCQTRLAPSYWNGAGYRKSFFRKGGRMRIVVALNYTYFLLDLMLHKGYRGEVYCWVEVWCGEAEDLGDSARSGIRRPIFHGHRHWWKFRQGALTVIAAIPTSNPTSGISLWKMHPLFWTRYRMSMLKRCETMCDFPLFTQPTQQNNQKVASISN